jgi:hypothetical protein
VANPTRAQLFLPSVRMPGEPPVAERSIPLDPPVQDSPAPTAIDAKAPPNLVPSLALFLSAAAQSQTNPPASAAERKQKTGTVAKALPESARTNRAPVHITNSSARIPVVAVQNPTYAPSGWSLLWLLLLLMAVVVGSILERQRRKKALQRARKRYEEEFFAD